MIFHAAIGFVVLREWERGGGELGYDRRVYRGEGFKLLFVSAIGALIARKVAQHLLAQQTSVEVGVDFGGGDAFVSEHHLDGA